MQINTFEELKEYSRKENKKIYEIAQEMECQNLGISEDKFRQIIKNTLDTMKEAIKTGLNNTQPTNGKMGGQDCVKLIERYKKNPSIFSKLFEKILTYALATSEENARMGKIAACPTAGACGIVPSILVSLFEELNTDNEKQINSLIVAGLIGKIISQKVKPAGAIAGCQAECGTAAAMAASAAAYLFGYNIDIILNSVSLCLKNILGLTCDPVRGFVEVPCIKRNPFMAIHAITAVELASAGIESVIPTDDVIDAMEQTGALMSPSLKESSLAGLAKTKTAIIMSKACFTKKYYSELND